jgi:hypothetical protein
VSGLDPHTSLAMTYLRAYIDGNPTRPRLRARAKHSLLMHWSVVATDPGQWVHNVGQATKSRSEGEDTREGIPSPQIARLRIPARGER